VRRESVAGPLRYWPNLLLATPLIVALIFNRGYQIESVLLVSAIFLVWTVKSLRYTLWSELFGWIWWPWGLCHESLGWCLWDCFWRRCCLKGSCLRREALKRGKEKFNRRERKLHKMAKTWG